jgi:hypothetical protein
MIRRLLKKAVHCLERAQLARLALRTRGGMVLVARWYLLDHAPPSPLRPATNPSLSA